MLNSLQGGRCSFITMTLLVHTTTPSIFTKYLFLYFSWFLPPYFTLTCSQNHPHNLHLHSIPPYLSNFSSFCFYIQPCQQSTPKTFSLPQPFSKFRLCERTRELENLVRTDAFLISPFLIKVWTLITVLTPYRPGSESWCIAGSGL